MASITKHLLSASISKGSTAAYKRSWNLFTEWAQSTLGETNLVLPIQPAFIALFVSHFYSLHYASSTVTSYLSAICYTHKLAGIGDLTETAIIRQIIKGYRKLVPAHDVRLPITLPILQQIISSFTHTTATAYQSKLLSAMSSLAFFAFLRVGEITVNTTDHSNLIRFTQLERLLDSQQQVKALQITIFKYKHTDSEGRPFVIYIYKVESCCPVTTILDFILARRPISVSGPLFCWPDEAPIKRSFFVEKLNNSLRFCNLDLSLYKSHGFRIGAARWVATQGFLIRKFVSWVDGSQMLFLIIYERLALQLV